MYTDECMAKLFTDGSVVNKSIEWMSNDNKDLSLKTTAALIIANMARTGMYIISIINTYSCYNYVSGHTYCVVHLLMHNNVVTMRQTKGK